jgi:histidine phosphotransfer protein HptB
MQLFDHAALLELTSELGKEDTAEVLKVFLADTSRKISAIAVELQARSTIKREAHSIKSSAATFGFVELSTLARELESGVVAMGPAQVTGATEMLRQAFERVESFVRENSLTSSAEIAVRSEALY